MTALGFSCLSSLEEGARRAGSHAVCVCVFFCSNTLTHPSLLQLLTLKMSQSNVEQIPKTNAPWNFNERAHFWGTEVRKSVSSHRCVSAQRNHKLFPSAYNASGVCAQGRACWRACKCDRARAERVKKSERSVLVLNVKLRASPKNSRRWQEMSLFNNTCWLHSVKFINGN